MTVCIVPRLSNTGLYVCIPPPLSEPVSYSIVRLCNWWALDGVPESLGRDAPRVVRLWPSTTSHLALDETEFPDATKRLRALLIVSEDPNSHLARRTCDVIPWFSYAQRGM